jgi:hypothetical protein
MFNLPGCGTVVGQINAGLLIVQQVSITQTTTVTALGVFGNMPSGLTGILVLYGDAAGTPGALKTSTNATPIAAGKNEIPVNATTTLPAGTYWIGGEYSATASICSDNAGTNSVKFVNVTYPTVPAPFGNPGPVMSSTSVDFNYYVVGTL